MQLFFMLLLSIAMHSLFPVVTGGPNKLMWHDNRSQWKYVVTAAV